MIDINIPGFGQQTIEHVVFDYNGTIAKDGVLIKGVKDGIKQFSDKVRFHVITADTFGFVKKQLNGIDCALTIIPEKDQAQSKLDYIQKLGTQHTLCVGNGSNDRMMLKAACIGIAVLQEEGLSCDCLLSSDLVIKHVLDMFGFLNIPQRLIATLRT
ncbi:MULTISPECIES: HAD family hydrolase [Desulfobacula]|uniref:Conserved uncharacterized protein n=2 Tax=Desulfobacula TaxID=28222 RepID=K0NK84_DESTT|nr:MULTISPECIES: HAD family hydrolase [Desulfobacula]CCK79207.1 conserved uncharacterized protein [Desulfobacula toluolica Tol2]SDU04459.1 Soluble P-type ATPase [Desulfobacula phenolica]